MPIKSYYFRDNVMTVEQGPRSFFLKLTVGATGAVSATSGYGLAETTPIVRNSAGNYTITMDRAFKKLLKVGHTMILGTPQDLVMTVTDDSIDSAQFTVEFSTGTTATDPSSGAIIIFEVIVADTSLNGGI